MGPEALSYHACELVHRCTAAETLQPCVATHPLTCAPCRFGYDSFSLTEATLGDVMQQAGYVTAHFGKW
jgi:hypothetical protein